MHTYIVQFVDQSGAVLDTQYVTAGTERAAKAEAFRRTKIRDFQTVEASRM